MRRITADDHEPIPHDLEKIFKERAALAPYPAYLGLILEEVRKDYARMRLPYRPELNQPAGIIHGGAIMSLIDTVVVWAVLSGVSDIPEALLTIDLHAHFLDMAQGEDCIAEAEVRHRGRKIVFLNVEVRTAGGTLVSDGTLSYKVVYKK